jgi:predicted PurR-regulated permease PerM
MPFSFNPEQKQNALWLAVGLALLFLLVKLGPVLAPFLAAAILAYALNPAVDRFCALRFGRFSMPRQAAVVVVLLVFFAIIIAVFLVVTPVLQKQIPLLQDQIPNLLFRLNAFLGPKLRDLGVQIRLDEIGVKRIVSKYMATSGDEIWATVLASARVGGIALIGWMVMIALVPIALFYLLLDWHGVVARITNLVPRRWVAHTVSLAQEVDTLLAQYLRGQLAVIVVLCIYYASTLALTGLEVAVPVGILTGLLIFIPYIGFGIGMVLALISAMLQFNDLHGVVLVASIYGVGQFIEGFILTPRLVGERIGLHPLTVIFALFAFGQLFGFVGVLLALPASAILSVAVKHMRVHYINSSFYRHT